MKKLLYILWQYTWGLPQNLVGGLLYLHYKRKGCRSFPYQGALAVIWPRRVGSMSMGRFLFLYEGWTPLNKRLLTHEYGPTIQSLMLGPMYLPLVGLPSVVWAGLPRFKRLRTETKRSYYSVYPENWANRCGDRFCKAEFPEIRDTEKPGEQVHI